MAGRLVGKSVVWDMRSFLLRQMAKGGAALAALTSIGTLFKTKPKEENQAEHSEVLARVRDRHAGDFPLILDEYYCVSSKAIHDVLFPS